jgi:lipopolysaccharide/colanic/teichoic acid biosynthesis glycosyltransferase
MYKTQKRSLDIIGSIVGLTIFSPIMIATAVFIKLVSPKGPVFADIPKRVGPNGKEFRLFKFRSMIPNAHKYLKDRPKLYKQYVKNNYKLDPDPRWIKGAGFFRKYSIDEMPQFINILLGEMSLVGPRAYYPYELREQEKKFLRTAEYIKIVKTIKPGLTGPWQVSGRSEIDFPKRIKMDAEYAKNKSVWYDIGIILKTPMAVISGKGAY